MEAVRYYGLAAAQGNADAQNNLGYCYQHGEGVAHDMVEAVRYYGLAAAQGHADAQINLASCYGRGARRGSSASAQGWDVNVND
jgi:hypothetical protein